MTESKVLMANEDPAVLNVPLITDPDGNVQRTLMDCILFMKNLPAHIEPPDSAGSLRNSPTPQPSSPHAWSPSPPCCDHRKVLPPPCSIPTRVPLHQPSLQQGVVVHGSNCQHMSRATCPAPALPKSRKVQEFVPVRKRQ